ncbi:class I SAM-dependent methyltransferase [bacterium]|nr:class I SAM-dependent methyltransferase [bacterium]
MTDRKKRVCPVEEAGGLEAWYRKWLQNPWKILRPYIEEGMTVLDFGCGPGYFTVPMAAMAGPDGIVIAADLQEGMLGKVNRKIQGTSLEKRIRLHQCKSGQIGLKDQVDFALAFYVIHELPDQSSFFRELSVILKKGCRALVIEPSFHVTRKEFGLTIDAAGEAGLKPEKGPGLLFSRSVLLKKV